MSNPKRTATTSAIAITTRETTAAWLVNIPQSLLALGDVATYG
jgi:hypothetical protein